MGNEDFIYLTLDSKRIIMKMKSEDILQIGDKIKISFEEEEMHLFDFNSKKSLKK
jgi:ABC-type sugar transport system ATPase subunit